MTWEQILDHLPSILVAIGTLIGSYVIIRKGRVEVKTLDADLASKYQTMLSIEQENSGKMQKDILTLKDEVIVLRNKLEEVQELLEEYAAGVDLLLAQLKTSGITPIWKPKKRLPLKEE